MAEGLGNSLINSLNRHNPSNHYFLFWWRRLRPMRFASDAFSWSCVNWWRLLVGLLVCAVANVIDFRCLKSYKTLIGEFFRRRLQKPYGGIWLRIRALVCL